MHPIVITVTFEESAINFSTIDTVLRRAHASHHWRLVAREPADGLPPLLVFWVGIPNPTDREFTEALERYENA